mmetsp:Transcript_24252/g.32297  ORF Transcript_24252/g.32297 Transcript_24252/m.32297 type:complete len:334 (+) Transcript_24252:458-1459(+)
MQEIFKVFGGEQFKSACQRFFDVQLRGDVGMQLGVLVRISSHLCNGVHSRLQDMRRDGVRQMLAQEVIEISMLRTAGKIGEKTARVKDALAHKVRKLVGDFDLPAFEEALQDKQVCDVDGVCGLEEELDGHPVGEVADGGAGQGQRPCGGAVCPGQHLRESEGKAEGKARVDQEEQLHAAHLLEEVHQDLLVPHKGGQHDLVQVQHLVNVALQVSQQVRQQCGQHGTQSARPQRPAVLCHGALHGGQQQLAQLLCVELGKGFLQRQQALRHDADQALGHDLGLRRHHALPPEQSVRRVLPPLPVHARVLDGVEQHLHSHPVRCDAHERCHARH